MKKVIIAALSLFTLNIVSYAQLDRSKVPAAQPNPEIKINIPDPMTFGNGLQVIMVENHKLPQVSFQLFVDYPSPVEGDIAGVSSIFGEMIGSGTTKSSKDEFDQKIDYMGADFFTTSRGFYASSLKKHTPSLLGLIKEVLEGPAFTQEDFDRIVSQNMSNLASLPSDANSISSNVESIINYGEGHPYGEIMTEATLGNITLEDVKAYHQKYFIPNHAYLVVVGDVSQEEVKLYIDEYFSQWAKGTAIDDKNYTVPVNKGNQVYFVNKPGAVQSVINITHTVDVKPGHPDDIKLRLMNSILGGGSFSARLMANLREDKAYTYGCYSQVNSSPVMGSFSAGGSFRNEVTDSAIVQILAEVKKITESEVTDKEIDLVKKSMTGAFARSLESPQTIARFALNTVRYNLPNNYYANYLRTLESISKVDLLMVAEKYLKPENLNIIVVGNEEIADKLEQFDADGKVSFKNYYGADQENLKPVAEGVTTQTIFEQYALNVFKVNSKSEMDNKMAGIGQIEKVSEARIEEYDVSILSYSAEGKGGKSASYVYVKSPMGNQVQQKEWFNGTEGELMTGPVTKKYTPEKIAKKQKSTFLVGQLGYANDADKTVELLGIAKVEEAEYYKIKVVDAGDEETDFWFEYYDLNSGLLTMQEIFVTDDNGEVQTAIYKFLNYEEKSGLMLPMTTEINNQGQVIELNNKTVTVNKKAKSKAFSGNFKKVNKLLAAL